MLNYTSRNTEEAKTTVLWPFSSHVGEFAIYAQIALRGISRFVKPLASGDSEFG
jgi:hypothetical protein